MTCACDAESTTLVRAVHELLQQRRATLAVAESLTGGLVGESLTALPGASTTFRGGIIAYATDVKTRLLGVPSSLLEARGAVDSEVATSMAAGVRDLLDASYGLALTGVAGPGPQEGKPAGTVHVALAGSAGQQARVSPQVPGDRVHVRKHAAGRALELLRRHLLGLPADAGWEQ